jgi:hypothetical protein
MGSYPLLPLPRAGGRHLRPPDQGNAKQRGMLAEPMLRAKRWRL